MRRILILTVGAVALAAVLVGAWFVIDEPPSEPPFQSVRVQMAWPSDDRREITIGFGGGHCDKRTRVVLTEAETEVTLTVETQSWGTCIMIEVPMLTTVRLREPLPGKLLRGRYGQPIPIMKPQEGMEKVPAELIFN